MEKVKWNRNNLTLLYYDKGMTLRDIATQNGVSFERVRQVMESLGIPRDKHRKHHAFRHYQSLSEYFIKHKTTTQKDTATLAYLRKYLPLNVGCPECGSNKNLILHHICYPAQSLNDIQILCKSCHKIKHNGKMPYLKQLDLYLAHKRRVKRKELAVTFNISVPLVDKIIHKIANNLSALKR